MFRVRHADAVLYYLLPALDLLHDAHQLPGILGHLVCERSDAVGHVQDGRTDLVGFRFQKRVLHRRHSDGIFNEAAPFHELSDEKQL